MEKTYVYGYENETYSAFKFVPEATGKYTINNSSVSFYDANGNYLGYDSVELTAGQTYFVGDGDIDSYRSFKITQDAEDTPME